eukprot:3683376-Ditylum_brightwellii.AAC.1
MEADTEATGHQRADEAFSNDDFDVYRPELELPTATAVPSYTIAEKSANNLCDLICDSLSLTPSHRNRLSFGSHHNRSSFVSHQTAGDNSEVGALHIMCRAHGVSIPRFSMQGARFSIQGARFSIAMVFAHRVVDNDDCDALPAVHPTHILTEKDMKLKETQKNPFGRLCFSNGTVLISRRIIEYQ